ncbi:unnamed protein product [Linum trigynum]|uniref:F-box domain-containing protein n=1 Tax=Linum trigynum TaxID=586398 RepID=A0AAV2FZU4_9ROSI
MGRASKNKKRHSPCADRISTLPDDIRKHILTKLPLRDAAKASVLSTKWRHLWAKMPSLVFDETFLPINTRKASQLMSKLCTVLLLHHGPLRELTLSQLPAPRSHPNLVESILMFLEKEGTVDSLTVTLGQQQHGTTTTTEGEEDRYLLPKRLFSTFFSSRLKTLRLSCCDVVWSSPCFEGFGVLHVLELRNVVFVKEESSSSSAWRFRCPLLSSLTLVDCGGKVFEEPDFVIEATKLGRFELDGKFSSLHLKDTPVLRTAILRKQFFSDGDEKEVEEDPSKLWDGLAAVESLYASGDLYRYLAGGNKETISLGRQLEMLTQLTLDGVCLSRRSDVWSALCLITKSPNLRRLSISMELKRRLIHDSIKSAQLGRLLNGEPKVHPLKTAEVKSFHGTKHEMVFVRWLLSSSPALETMEIELSSAGLSADDKESILAELNEFGRPSATTKVVIKQRHSSLTKNWGFRTL